MADKKKREGRDNQWVDDLEGYSRQIWLAGLGAYTRMGKEGAKLFESLIRDGEQAEKTAKAEADKAGGKSARSKKDPLEGARAKVDKARSKLIDKFGGLEEMFDKRVAGAVERLGLAQQDELQALESRVAELTRAVEQLNAKPARPRKPAAAAAATASSTVIADSLAQAATEAAATPAAKATPRRARSTAAKPAASKSTAAKATSTKAASSKAGAAAPVKTTTRRRAATPKAATRGKSAPAPATDAEPGKPTEQ
ncbi:phasin family protein [Halopseudomonas bauzanensis]|uniref:phasin family protein n=1 Tax=Halopseudomonas bauzanensis TaxID=653930 RepID=UPI002554ED14|nr:phasin family protein [Halopseudomonas bauzanensis]